MFKELKKFCSEFTVNQLILATLTYEINSLNFYMKLTHQIL